MGVAPIGAIKKVLDRTGMTIDDVDVVELNEAFAAQVIPIMDECDIPLEKMNTHGGAIALGHPFGMTGARIMTTLLNVMETDDHAVGLETMCVAGGQGEAMIVERLELARRLDLGIGSADRVAARLTSHLRNNIVDYVAVFIALSAGAYAAGLKKNSVKSKQIKDGAVVSADVGDDSLTGVDDPGADARRHRRRPASTAAPRDATSSRALRTSEAPT